MEKWTLAIQICGIIFGCVYIVSFFFGKQDVHMLILSILCYIWADTIK